jgi:hypothetical protein
MSALGLLKTNQSKLTDVASAIVNLKADVIDRGSAPCCPALP